MATMIILLEDIIKNFINRYYLTSEQTEQYNIFHYSEICLLNDRGVNIMLKMPHQHNLELMKTMRPSMKYDGSEPFENWQCRAAKKLNELLGLPFQKCDDMLTIEYKKERDGFTDIRFYFQSESGYFVPCNLWIPAGAKKTLPVVICLQGHSTGMHISLGKPKYPGDESSIKDGDRDFAVRVLKEGYCALSIEQRNFGECGGNEKGPDCYKSSMAAILIGRTTLGERVWDIQRAIDVLEKHFSQVDMKNIICMGNSGGGTATFYAGCLEPRIKYIMPSCAICTYEDSIGAIDHCSCNFIPGIRKYFDMGDLAGLIAPRYLVIVSGKNDDIFPLDGVQKTFEIVKLHYKYANAPNNCMLVVGKEGHRFYADDAWLAMNAYISG
jgi:dienelactone hydrolase